MLDRLFALETFGIKLGLDNIALLCDALDHPERAFKTLHVAGTNGKGSVTAMVHTALVGAGVAAARYISPHLLTLNERFVIGTEPVSDDALAAVTRDVFARIDMLKANGRLAVTPTFFEVTTAIAFELFRRARTEVAVIEVGLGGRFDATNVVLPEVAAITSIGFDHQQHLGDSLGAIAGEKAGIIKPGVPVVVGRLPDEAMRVIGEVAAERQAPLIAAGAGVNLEAEMRDGRATLAIETPAARYGPLTLGLRGDHQVGNALVAVRMLEAARGRGIDVSRSAIERGLTAVTWPARLEVIDVGEQRVLIDAAHNADGARALAAYLRRWHPERPALVAGVMRDKDVDEILAALLPATSLLVATEAATPRALPASELAARARRIAPAHPVQVEPSPAAALQQALGQAQTVCVAGSIFLAGEVRAILR